MKKTLLAAGAVLALSSSFTVNAAENDKPQYLSDWWHQSVNVVGSYHTRFGPQIRNDTYLEYEAFAKKDWFDFYGYADAPVFFGGNSDAKGIWNHGSPLFMEIEPRFSIDKLTNTDLSFGPFKEWYFANNYIYDILRSLALLCRSSLLARRWSVERRCRTELRQRQLQRSLYRLGWLPGSRLQLLIMKMPGFIPGISDC